MKILAISGSLRAASWNTRLLHAAGEHAPAGVNVEVYRCGALPFYDQDIDGETRPAPVVDLRERAQAADALLFATPEYNYSVSGVLKNAIDWLSRPAFKSPLTGKPAGLMSAAPGPVGGARAQAHLKAILAGTLSPLYPSVEMLVPAAGEKFDGQGRLVDEVTVQRLVRYMDGFSQWLAARG